MKKHCSSILTSFKEYSKMTQTVKIFLVIWMIGLLSAFSLMAQSSTELEYQPEEIGKRVVPHIVEQRVKWRYQRVCAYYGACRLSEAIDDERILQQMETIISTRRSVLTCVGLFI